MRKQEIILDGLVLKQLAGVGRGGAKIDIICELCIICINGLQICLTIVALVMK